jgi:hypothetical protein
MFAKEEPVETLYFFISVIGENPTNKTILHSVFMMLCTLCMVWVGGPVMGMPWAIFSLKVCSNGVLGRTRVGGNVPLYCTRYLFLYEGVCF